MKLQVTINNESRTFEIPPNLLLVDLLRCEGYFGVKRGCESGDCGACTVIVDGVAIKSCLTLAAQTQGRNIITIEGIGTPANPHPLQTAFVKEGAVQCGYCVPGMILTAKALLDKNPNPTEADIKNTLDGNLCRCTGYVKQIAAVKKAAARIRGEE